MKFYQQISRKLKKDNLLGPVSVCRSKLSPSLDGDCQVKNSCIVIRINRELEEGEAILTLLHEFSHAICFQTDKNYQGTHNAIWGKTYAKLYRNIVDNYMDSITF